MVLAGTLFEKIKIRYMVQKFRKKPITVDGLLFKGYNREEVEEFMGKQIVIELESDAAYQAGVAPPVYSFDIVTKEGVMKAMTGDYILKEPFPTGDRDFYPCKPDILAQTYDEVFD